MKKSKFLKVFSSAMALSVILAGCSTSNNSSSKNAPKAKVEFKTEVDNGGSAVDGATLKYGILSSTPLTGMWNPIFSTQATDYEVIGNVVGDTFSTDDERKVKQDNEDDPVKFHLDREKKEITFTVHKDLKWSDGSEVTAKDIVATYELMGNPKFKENARYTNAFDLIEGMKDYHEGKADKISGITEKDNKTVVVKYTEIKPSVLFGEGWVSNVLNAKQVADASKDFTKVAEADLNKKPLSFGPYVIAKEVNGESVLAEANPHYYKKDDVKVKKIEFKVVSPAQASSVIKNGDVDLLGNVTSNVWDSSKDLKNGDFLSKPSYYLSYVGFRTGQWDKEKSENVEDPDSKLKDKNVRQAFELAVDRDQINEKIFKGLRFTPTGSGMYPAATGKLQNEKATAVKKDVEKAKKLLDEAGYKDTDGDGLRENKNGEKLVFNYAARNTGSDLDQALADNFIKSWKEVGLDVKLVDGKLLSPKDWSTRVQADDPSIDIFQGAWGFFNNPNPNYIAGGTSKLNLPRYIDETLTKDLEAIDSKDSFDDNKIKEAFNKFDNDFAEVAPWIPLSWSTDIVWVNKRVKNIDLKKYNTFEQQFYELELTSDKGIKS